MSQGIRRPWEAVDISTAARLYPPPPEYFETVYYEEPDVIEHKQLIRLQEKAHMASRVPFFARRWEEAGFDPRDLRSLDDLWKAPYYTVDDIRKSIDANPPYGDYQGITPERVLHEPMRLYMSGGTTGQSRPTFYTQWDREVGSLLTARQLYMQGVRPGDVVLNSWSYGTHNGAFAFDEALYRWLNCIVITTSTGTVTSSQRQVDYILQYGATCVMTTGDYVLRLAEVAKEMGYEPRDLGLKAIPNVGDTKLLEETFGVPVYASYGFHEVQTVAVECPARNGLHIFEDAFVIQVVDPETGEPLPDGELGSLCVTELYKTGSPQFRYNIMDLSYLMPREKCECGSWLRKMGPFAGRGDNMVKLRGVNVWPEALGELALTHPEVEPDYFVRAVRENNRDDLIISVVSRADQAQYERIAGEVADMLHGKLGVRIQAQIVPPGSLDELTEYGSAAKLKRFRDERGN
jgi:phenylacetate-CoA ligase